MDAAAQVRGRQRRNRRRAATVGIFVMALCAAATVLGCTARRSTEPAIAPVDPPRAPTTSSTAGRTGPPGADAPADPPTTPPPSTDPEEVVQAVLTEYATVLTELSADPAGAPAPGSAARLRWDQVVAPTSALSPEILGRLHDRATVDHVVVQPGADGISYRHRLVAVDHAEHTAVDFSWCGWAPGVGRSLIDGAVVDDQVAHATGTGRAELDGGRWRLTRLDQLELELLPAGAADPCPNGDGVDG